MKGKSSTNSLHPTTSDVYRTFIDAAFQQPATTMHEGFNLPKPELLTFNGTPTDYCKFIKNFETNIEGRVSDYRLRLNYLIQYCNGEAKSCIEDCVLLEPSEGYTRAKSILYSRYGGPHIVARSYIDKLVYGTQIKAFDIDGLSRLALEIQKCEITLVSSHLSPLTLDVVGAPQMTLKQYLSILPCLPLPTGNLQTPFPSIPRCYLPISSSVFLSFLLLSLSLAELSSPCQRILRCGHTI